MKREFKKAMKPRKSFEEWAKDNDVELKDYTPITKKQYFSRWIRQRKVIVGISTFMVVCFILVAILVPVLSSNGSEPIIPTHKIYTAQDSVSERVEELDELYQIDNLLLFDRRQIAEFSRIFKDIANDDETLILSYMIYDCFIMTSDEVNAFYINYRIRLYEYYEFVGHSRYLDLTHSFIIDDNKIDYEIIEESKSEKRANISFAYNDLEYFLEVKGFEDVTDITENTLKVLLNDLFTIE